MTFEVLRQYCCAKKGVLEDYPFDETTAVFKIMGKMFALANSIDFVLINVKCDPELALELRAQYDAVTPGYHMSKKHWNSLQMDGSLEQRAIFEWIDHSYDLVVSKLPKLLKEELAEL